MNVDMPPNAPAATPTAAGELPVDAPGSPLSTNSVEIYMLQNPRIEEELQAIRAVIPFDYQPKGVTCPQCATWIMVKPKTELKYYVMIRAEYVGVFFTEAAAIQGWLHKYSNNHHKGFSDYNKAVQYFNEHLASGKVVDKKGVVSAMTDDGPVYVPGLPGLSYAKVTAVPPASSLAAPY